MADDVEQKPAAPEAPPLVIDGEKVAIRDSDGSVSMVQRTDLDAAIGEGARPATEHEYNEAKLGKAGEVATSAIGAGQGLSFGYALPAAIGGAEALGLDDTAADIRRGAKLARESSPNAYLGGEVGGALAGAALLPGGAGGNAVRAESIAGRALERGIAAAPRAFAEGAAIGVGQQATEDAIDDKDFAASSYLTAAGKGGAVGLLAGAGLHAGFGAAADRAALLGRGTGAVEGAVGVESRAQPSLAEAALGEKRALGRVTIDPDAGLSEGAGAIEKPFVIGRKRHGVSLDGGALEGEFASGVNGGSPITSRAHADLNQPLRGPVDDIRTLFTNEAGLPPREDVFKIGRVRDSELFTDAASPVYARQPLAERAGTIGSEGSPIGLRAGIDPNAGLAGEDAAQDVFRISRRKDGARTVGLGDVEPEGMLGTRRGIGIEKDSAAIAEAAAAERAAAAGAPKGPREWLEGQANRQAFKATGAKAPDVRRLAGDVESQQAEMERIGERLRSYKLADGRALIEPTLAQNELAKRVVEAANEVGKDLGKLRGELDRAVARPSMNEIAQRFEQEVARPASKMPLGEADVAAAQKYLDDMIVKGGDRPSFDTLYSYRRRLDDKLAKEYQRFPNVPGGQGSDAMHALRGIIESEYTTAGERAAKEIGSEFASRYKLTKELYADLATARKIARGEAERNGGANFISLTDAIAGFSTGGLGGIAAVAANQIRRKQGNQILSHVLGEAAKLFPVQRAASEVDGAISKGARSFIEGTGSAAARPAKKVTAAEVRAVRDSVRTPEMVQARIAAAVGDMAEYAPKQAQAIATAMTRVAVLLRDTLPKEPAPVGISFNRPQRPLSDTELQRAAHIIETAEDPTIVLDRLIEGRLSRAHIETMKQAHPEVYARTQRYITDHATELKKRLTVQQEVVLSLLFGQPVNEAMLPDNVRAFQATFSQGSQAPAQDGSAGGQGLPVRGADVGASRATALDRIEKGSK